MVTKPKRLQTVPDVKSSHHIGLVTLYTREELRVRHYYLNKIKASKFNENNHSLNDC